MGQPTQPTCRLFSLLPSWPLLPVPLLAPWLLPLAMPPQTLLSLQCTLTSMVTMEMESSKMSPMREFLSMDLLLSRLLLLATPLPMLLLTQLLLLAQLLMLLLIQSLLLTQLLWLSQLLLHPHLPMLLPPLSSVVKQQIIVIY